MSEFREQLAHRIHDAHGQRWCLLVPTCPEAWAITDALIASGVVADPAEVERHRFDAEHFEREYDDAVAENERLRAKVAAVEAAKAEFQYVKSDLEHARSAGAAYQRLYAEAKAEAEALLAQREMWVIAAQHQAKARALREAADYLSQYGPDGLHEWLIRRAGAFERGAERDRKALVTEADR